MPYYLLHHFDPTFDYQHLKPRQLSDGNVDFYNLGYVQNVRKGDVLAEWRDADDMDDLPEDVYSVVQCIYEDKIFPAGKNTCVDPEDPDRLLAEADGYVFYLEGFITVKRTLNVRRDVDFHTGNIFFLGNVIVHGCVRSGFSVHGVNVMIREAIDGAEVKAESSIVAEGGVKGRSKAELRAKGNIRASFVENATLLAGKCLLVDGACMHSDVFSHGQLAVKGMLVGGTAVSSRIIYVGEQLGGGLSTETVLIVGYDAELLHKASLLRKRISKRNQELDEARLRLKNRRDLREDMFPKVAALEDKLKKLKKRHREIWEKLNRVQDLESCRVIVPGKVRPGVEVTIGEARYVVKDYMENVCFRYRDYEVVVESPALQK